MDQRLEAGCTALACLANRFGYRWRHGLWMAAPGAESTAPGDRGAARHCSGPYQERGGGRAGGPLAAHAASRAALCSGGTTWRRAKY